MRIRTKNLAAGVQSKSQRPETLAWQQGIYSPGGCRPFDGCLSPGFLLIHVHIISAKAYEISQRYPQAALGAPQLHIFHAYSNAAAVAFWIFPPALQSPTIYTLSHRSWNSSFKYVLLFTPRERRSKSA